MDQKRDGKKVKEIKKNKKVPSLGKSVVGHEKTYGFE